MSEFSISREARFELIGNCFKICINSFEEKALTPYEKDCMSSCLENQVSTLLELHNNTRLFMERKKSLQAGDN